MLGAEVDAPKWDARTGSRASGPKPCLAWVYSMGVQMLLVTAKRLTKNLYYVHVIVIALTSLVFLLAYIQLFLNFLFYNLLKYHSLGLVIAHTFSH